MRAENTRDKYRKNSKNNKCLLGKNSHDKYRKDRKNNKSNKNQDFEKEEFKEGPKMSAIIAKIAKVTRFFLASLKRP